MIIFDTETTGLPEPAGAPLTKQPSIIEFGAIKFDDNNPEQEIDRLEFLINPGTLPLPPIITEITGIKDDDLRDKPRFPAVFPHIVEFFLGERFVVAHNLQFDLNLLSFELRRMNRQYAFPWPPVQICTVEATMHLNGYRLKLDKLHEMATGTPVPEAHRAIKDVEALHTAFMWCFKQGHVKLT